MSRRTFYLHLKGYSFGSIIGMMRCMKSSKFMLEKTN